MSEDIIDTLDRWGRWSCKKTNLRLDWPALTIIGKALLGMPTSRCGLCLGQRQIPGWRVGVAAKFITCPQCTDGRVHKSVAADKMNPAFIYETGNGGNDEIFYQVDFIYHLELNQSDQLIIYNEFLDGRGGGMSAAKRMKKTVREYNMMLQSAANTVERRLHKVDSRMYKRTKKIKSQGVPG